MAKKALLVGVNTYQTPGNDLRGCVNDVIKMGNALVKYYDFDPVKDIRVLTDGEARKNAIQSEMSNLIEGAKAGDVVYIHFSGHGSHVPDRDGDEKEFDPTDVFDEILCPTDLDWNDPLVDDWIRGEIEKLPEKVNLTLIFDCCHSGSATRAVVNPFSREPTNRFMSSPFDLLGAESASRTASRSASVAAAPAERALPQDILAVDGMKEVFVSGCRDDETSADAHLNGTWNGALTFSLVETIKKTNGKLTCRDLHAGACAELASNGFRQHSQFKSGPDNLDKQFLAPY